MWRKFKLWFYAWQLNDVEYKIRMCEGDMKIGVNEFQGRGDKIRRYASTAIEKFKKDREYYQGKLKALSQ